MARLATDKKSSTQRTNTNYSSQAQRDKRAVPKAQNKTSYTTLVFPEQTGKSAPASNIPNVVLPSASVREQERISDTSAHGEAEREKARKESHVTNNILFEQWKTATDKKKERESKQPSFLERAKDTITGTLTERLGSDVGALRAMYESGQNSRTAEYEREMAELQPQIERAQRAYDEMRALYGEQGATVEYNTLQDLQRRYDAYKFVTENNVQEQATAATSDMSNQLSAAGAQKLERAKEGLGAVGRVAVDIGSGAVNLLADSALGKVGGSTLSNAALGLRGFGNTVQAAESAGAGIGTQVTAGAVEAAKEIGMGKLFDGLAGIYGKGAADEIIESAVDKLAKTDAGRNALRALAKSTGEGAEELIESKLDPLVSAIYDHGEALRQKYGNGWDGYKEAAADDLYSGLIGFALGAGGQIVSAARGDYARANEELKRTAAPAEQTAPVQQNTAQPQTENSAVNVIEALLAQGKISNSQAGKVVESPTLADAFYEVTGIALEGTKAQKRAAIKAAAQTEAQTSPVADVQPTGDISTPPAAQNVKQGDSDALNNTLNLNSRETQTAAPTLAQQNTAPTQETEKKPLSMADYVDKNSSIWNNLDYNDTAAQTKAMREAHERMTAEGRVVKIPESTQKKTAESFPDLRGMKKSERTPILKQKMAELKSDIRQFLNGLKGGSFEFEVNGNVLEAKLYDTGIKEVLEKITQDKANMLNHSDLIFDNAEYLYSLPDYDGNPNVYRWNYFYTPVQIGDSTAGVRIALRDMKQTDSGKTESQIYNWGIKKTPALDGGSPEKTSLSTGVSSAGVIDTTSERYAVKKNGFSQADVMSVSDDISSDTSISTASQNVKQNFAAESPTLAQQNTAPTQETGSTIINDNPATHTAEEMKRIEEYKAAVDDNLVNYIETVRNNPGAKIGRYSLKPVSERAANDIKAITGVDVSGSKTSIEPRMIDHIFKDHGEHGKSDHSMRDINDIARVQYVLDNYDKIEDGGRSTAYQTVKPNGRTGQARTVKFSKAVDGTYYVVEAVPDTKAKTVFVVTTYLANKKTGDMQTANAEATRVTSETENAQSPVYETSSRPGTPQSGIAGDVSDISISTDTQNVKQNFAGNGRAPFKATYNKEPQTARKKKLSRFWENTLQRTETAAGVVDNVKQPLFYLPKTEKQSLAEAASRLSSNKQQAVEKLVSAEAWSGTQVDTAAAVATDLYKEARETGNYEAYTAWRKVMENHVTEGGRGIQALAKYSRETGENALNTIANMIEKSNLTPEQRQALINKVGWYAARFDEINEITKENNGILSNDNKAALISLIEDMAHERGTWTFVKKLYSDLLKKQDGDYLGKYAYKQILAMGGDVLSKATFAEKVKAYQTLAQLTSLATFKRNIGGNISFGIVDTLAQDGFGVAIDHLVSKATGKRTVAIDKGWFSSAARTGAIDAMQKSILEVAGDVAGNQNRFDMTAGRAFKMDGNAFERFMSRWQQLLGYSLTTSDKFSRGAIESEQERGLNALNDSGLTPEEIGELTKSAADIRLFQNQGVAYAASKWVHDFANLAGFGGKVDPKDLGKGRQGGFGAGDLINTYPGVPANLGVKPLEYSPANIVKGGIELIKVINDAKAGKLSAVKQQQAVMDISRGLAGVPAIVLVGALVKAGLIKNWDDEEDPDIRAQNAAEGKTGVQVNLTGALRYLKGETSEITWEPGDKTESIGWLEPINAFLAIGSLMAKEGEDAGIWDYAGDWAEGSVQALLEIPVMSNIADICDTFQYSTADNFGGKVAEAAAQYAGNIATGFIPSFVRSAAKASDPYYRDTSGDTPFERSWNQIKNTIPGLRETLDVKLDNFGNPKVYSGSTVTRAFNAFSNPGDRKTITQSEASKVIESLYKQTGDAEIYPDRKGVNRIKVNGESFELSAKEKREYKRVSGNTSEELIESLINNSLYKKAEPDVQAQLIKDINSYAESKATADWADSRGLYLSNEYTELEREGISDVTNYLIAEQALSTAKNAPTDTSYSYLDEIIDYWSKLSQPTQEKLRDSQLNVDALRYADNLGIDSKDWYSTKNAIAKSAKTMGKTDVATAISVYNNTKEKSDTEILNAIRSQLVPDEGGKQNATVRRIEAYNKIAGENADLHSWLNLLAELHDADENSSVSKKDVYTAWSNMGLGDNETYAGITRNDFYNIVKSNNSYTNNEKYATQIDEAYARIDPAQEKEKAALSGTVNGLQTIWQILGI